jgi:hypothetical protein
VLLGAEVEVVHTIDEAPDDETPNAMELGLSPYAPGETDENWFCHLAVAPYPPRGTKPCELEVIDIY